jgi:hypothetical protein
MTGKKVALVDFDLHQSSLGKIFDSVHKRGVSDYLSGNMAIADLPIKIGQYENLYFITAGKSDNDPSETIDGKKTEDQILQEFLQTFEIAHSIRNSDAPNYVVTKEEFEEYYNNISASIDNDAEFELILTNAWRLTEESRRGMGTKGWASEGADKPPHQRGAQPSNIFNRDDFGA